MVNKVEYLFFQIFGSDGRPVRRVDGADTCRANWMQVVSVVTSSGRRPNLWACQVDDVIYFYGLDAIPARTELTVGYCRQYSLRVRQVATLAGMHVNTFISLHASKQNEVAWWYNRKVSDLESIGRGFDSWSGRSLLG